MATTVAELAAQTGALQPGHSITICHFTTAHTGLKSRSFHRQMLPLAESGARIRYVAPLEQSTDYEGMEFIALPMRKVRLTNALSLSLLRTLVRADADLYHFQDPELLPIGLVLKLFFRKRVVYDAYEDFPSMVENKTDLPKLFRRVLSAMIDRAERSATRHFDGVVTADASTLRRLARSGKVRKLVFYNFPNPDFFPPPRQKAKRFDLVYRGGISRRTGICVLLEALQLLTASGRSVRLLLIGYFDSLTDERAFRDLVRERGLASRVVIRGRLEHQRMADALSEACIGVSPLLPVPKFLRNIPVKVFEYWACGLPVVASALPPILPFFRNNEAGLLYPPETSEELSNAIAWLLDHPDAAARMGARGRELVMQRLNNRTEVHKLRRFCARVAARGAIENRAAREPEEGGVLCSSQS